MIRFIIVCLAGGIVFAMLDGIINANPYAQKLNAAYKTIAKTKINAPAGIVIDIFYGFVIGYCFILLYPALPTNSSIMKGIIFAAIIWFFRVLMNVISSWMMYKIPVQTLAYQTITGLLEMLALGILYGAFLTPISF